MLLTLANVLYVLVAIAMTILILLQRGAGATAGSGFGAGASATVFGARGSANFLSKSTAVLAALFFVISLGMAIYASRSLRPTDVVDDDLGIMGSLQTEVPAAEVPVAPAVTDGEVPTAPAASATAAPSDEVPAAPAASSAVEVEKPAAETAEKQNEKSQN